MMELGWIVAAVLYGLGLITMYSVVKEDFFYVSDIHPTEWLIVVCWPMVVFYYIGIFVPYEAGKLLFKRIGRGY